MMHIYYCPGRLLERGWTNLASTPYFHAKTVGPIYELLNLSWMIDHCKTIDSTARADPGGRVKGQLTVKYHLLKAFLVDLGRVSLRTRNSPLVS